MLVLVAAPVAAQDWSIRMTRLVWRQLRAAWWRAAFWGRPAVAQAQAQVPVLAQDGPVQRRPVAAVVRAGLVPVRVRAAAQAGALRAGRPLR